MKAGDGIGQGFVHAAPPEPGVHNHHPVPPTGNSWLRWTEGLGAENPPFKKRRASKTPGRGRTSQLAVSSSERQEEPAERPDPRRIRHKQRHSPQETALVGGTAGRRSSKVPNPGDALYHHRNDLDIQQWTRDGFHLYMRQDAATVPTSMDTPSRLQPFLGTFNPNYVNTGLQFWPNFAFPLLYTTRLASLDDARSQMTTTAPTPFPWPPAPGSLLMSVLLLFGASVEAMFKQDTRALEWHNGDRAIGGPRQGRLATSLVGIKAMLCREISENLDGVTANMRRLGLNPGSNGDEVSAWSILIAVFSLALASLMTKIDDDWEVHMHGLKSILNVVGGMSALGRASPKVLSEFRMMDIEGSIASGKAPMLPFSRIYDALELQIPTSLSDLVTVQAQLEECHVDAWTIRTIMTSYALVEASHQAKCSSVMGESFVAKCKPEELMEEFASIQYELMCHPDPLFFRQHTFHPDEVGERRNEVAEITFAMVLIALHKAVRIGTLLYVRQLMVETPYAKRSYVRLLTELMSHLGTVLHYLRPAFPRMSPEEGNATGQEEHPQQDIRRSARPIVAWICVLAYYFSSRFGADLPLNSREAATVHWDVVREVFAGTNDDGRQQTSGHYPGGSSATDQDKDMKPQREEEGTMRCRLAMCRLLNLKFIAGDGWDGEKTLGIMLQWR
ncbi:hypothetical protein PG993_015236 [Apiospora rasikravindrae]|uniref:Uncharacterized protein n=1 Tax=Apiospora rasikravindrae TaxID=990691 RepID=A0ABR1RQE0_9PEZI